MIYMSVRIWAPILFKEFQDTLCLALSTKLHTCIVSLSISIPTFRNLYLIWYHQNCFLFNALFCESRQPDHAPKFTCAKNLHVSRRTRLHWKQRAIFYRQKHILLIYKQFTVKLTSHVGKQGPPEKYHRCNIKTHKGGIQKFTWKYQGCEFCLGLTELYNLHQGGRKAQPFSPGSDSKSLIFRVNL